MKKDFKNTARVENGNVAAARLLVAATRKGQAQEAAKATRKKAKPGRTLRHPFGGK